MWSTTRKDKINPDKLFKKIYSYISEMYEVNNNKERTYSNAVIITLYIIDMICNKKKSYHYRDERDLVEGSTSWDRDKLTTNEMLSLRKSNLDDGTISTNQNFFGRLPWFDDGSFVLNALTIQEWINDLKEIIIKQSFWNWEKCIILKDSNPEIEPVKINYDCKIKQISDEPENETDLTLKKICYVFDIKKSIQSVVIKRSKYCWESCEFSFYNSLDFQWDLLKWKLKYKNYKFKVNDKDIGIDYNKSPLAFVSSFLFHRECDEEIEETSEGTQSISYKLKDKIIQKDTFYKDHTVREYLDESTPINSKIKINKKNIVLSPPSNNKDLNKLFKKIRESVEDIFPELIDHVAKNIYTTKIPRRNDNTTITETDDLLNILKDTMKIIMSK